MTRTYGPRMIIKRRMTCQSCGRNVAKQTQSGKLSNHYIPGTKTWCKGS
jgi:predicted ATP-grasp superfamily ATP-dependent carboligase